MKSMKTTKQIGVLSVAVLNFLAVSWTHADTIKQPVEPASRLRGFTVDQMSTGTLYKAATVWKANGVRYMMRPWYRAGGRSPSESWKRMLDALPAQLDEAKRLNMTVVLALFEIPNEHQRTYPSDGKWNEHFWDDASNSNVLAQCWRDVATLCKDRDQEIWFDLLNEPLDWRDLYKTAYPKNWPLWAQGAIDAIRQIDTRHLVVVEAGPGSLSWGFRKLQPLKGDGIIYSTHFYQPQSYTHQGISDLRSTDLQHAYLQRQRPYPGNFDQDGGNWDKGRLRQEIQCLIDFQRRNNVRVYIGEFGVAKWAPNADVYLRDLIETFESLGWDWTYHALDENAIWSPEFTEAFDGSNPPQRATQTTERGRVLLEYMKRNADPATGK